MRTRCLRVRYFPKMHLIFFAYGGRHQVEIFLRDLEAQKFKLLMWKDEDKKTLWTNGVIRQLPFGAYEYIIPKESLDMVLQSLDFDKNPYNRQYWINLPLTLIRKVLKAKKIPKFSCEEIYLWDKKDVAIVPIGIKEDAILTESNGWIHEAL